MRQLLMISALLLSGCGESGQKESDSGSAEDPEDTSIDGGNDRDGGDETDSPTLDDTDTTSDADGDAGTDADSGVDSDSATDTGEALFAAFTVEAILASDEDYEAPGTVGIVTWSAAEITPEQAEIRFGLTTDYDLRAPVDLDESGFRTLLLGMKPDRTYHFQIAAESGGRAYVSEDYTIDTGPASNLVALTASVENPSLHERGYIVSTQLQSPMDDNSVVFILDPDGDLVWWYLSQVGQTSRAHISYNGKSMWLIPDQGALGSAPIQRISLDTLESTMYDVGASHDAIPAGEDMLAFIEYGEGDCGSVFELYEDGYTREIFESSDLLPGLVPNECHTNAIRYYESEGLYSVSDYRQDIFVIDTEGVLQWRLTDYISRDTWGGIQHGHQLLEDSIVLFANMGGASSRAAVIEYALPSGEELFRYDPGIFSSYYGDAQRLPGGNTLATFSVSGIIHEVTPDGEPVMTVSGSAMGYAHWLPSLYVE